MTSKPEQQMQLFSQLMQSMDSLYENYARKNGLTYMSLYILETIYAQTSCTQTQISEQTLYPKQSVNMVIRLFQSKGWLQLVPGQTDRRRKLIQLTPAGKAFAQQIIDPFWCSGSLAFAELDETERAVMLRTLLSFVRVLTEKVQCLPAADLHHEKETL